MSYLRDETEALACSCYQCQSGEEVDMAEWLEQPMHRKIHEQVRAALQRGDIDIQGEANEDAKRIHERR